MSLIDPIKYLIKDLSIDSDIKSFVNKTTDSQIEGSTSGELDIPRIFLETLKMWDKKEIECYKEYKVPELGGIIVILLMFYVSFNDDITILTIKFNNGKI